MRKIVFVLLSISSLLAIGAESKAPRLAENQTESKNVSAGTNEERLEVQRPGQSTAKPYGFVELRPSWISDQGETHTENTAELGYQFSSDLRLTYVQWFNTNMYNPKTGPTNQGQGLGLNAQDGFLRTKVNNIWVSADKTWNFKYQNRAFLPTYADRRDAGMVTYNRNYFTLTKTLGKVVSTDFNFVPTFFIYNRSGVTKPGGATEANPVAENEMIWNFDFHLTDKLLFSVPLIAQITRYRNFLPTARYNDRWGWNFWAWPEVDYDISPTVTVGVAFYTDNFVKDDLSSVSIGDAFRKGISQFILSAKL